MNGTAADQARLADRAGADERSLEWARLHAALEGAALAERPEGRLTELAARFGLDAAETDLLGTLWMGAVDPAMHAAVAAQDPVQGQVTVLTIARLFGHPARPRLPAGSPLLTWAMVSEHELASGGAALTIDPHILAWLDGTHELDRMLRRQAELLPLGPELSGWPVDATAARIAQRLQRGEASRLRLQTDDAVAARWFAAAIGMRLGLPVLALNGAERTLNMAMRVHRQAFLDNSIPYFSAGQEGLSAPFGFPPFPIQIIHSDAPLPNVAPNVAEVMDIEAVLAPPSPDERLRLWRRLLPECVSWDAKALETLALCHIAEAGDIAAITARQPADPDEAAALLRARGRAEAGPLTRRIDAVFRWDDLVLPRDVQTRLEEFAFEVRERSRLWTEPEAQRLFPYGRGLVGMFAGPPGTGKTMAAQVIAGELGLDLLAVDLSAVISKWVGETAQNLQELLSSRPAQNSILFFDEADALFAKRVDDMRDAQDRFANFDSSHLMTAIEAYSGVVILATNLRANIDTAFLRRIRHIVDFARPDAAAREAIWAKAVTALFPARQARTLRPELCRVARFEASGALIKNAALSALFTTRRTGDAPSSRLLAEMLARELGKEGAGLSARDIDAMLGEAG